MRNRLTIKGTARLSDVGKPTVLRASNNESDVNQHMCGHAEAVMNQYGFSLSRSVRAMRGQNDRVVTIVVTRLDSLSENLVVQTVLPAFHEQGYDPTMMESQFPPQLVVEHLGALKRRNIDGVMLLGFTGIIEEMSAYRQPSLVLLARDAKGFASACYDDEGAIKILIRRLHDQGYCNISYLDVPYSDTTTDKRRHEAYLAFCKAHKLHPVAVLPGFAMKQDYENAARVIAPEATALLYATGTLALGASKYLQEQRIDTLQLTSVGNTPLMRFLHPKIVTVDSGYAETGRQAVCQLVAQVTGRSEPQQTIIPTTLSWSFPER